LDSDARLKLEEKDNFIENLKKEIFRLKEEFAIDFEEFKLQHELKTQDLEERCKRQQAKLTLYERNAEFDEVLATYNAQMQAMEADNNFLLAEIRRVIKVETSIVAIQVASNDPTVNIEQLRENFDKVTKSQKLSLKTLTKQLQKYQTELEEFRKKERIFNLHKRCANDSNKRVHQLSHQLQKAQQMLEGANG
jgi:hypothetical protein